MIAEVDDDGSGQIEFPEFVKVIENQKRAAMEASSEEDTIMAFVAVGGYVGADGEPAGEVSADKIRKVVEQFKLTIDIDVSGGKWLPPEIAFF